MDTELYSMAVGYSLLSVVIFSFVIITITMIIVCALSPRRSQKYRKLLADLYVAGKIKKIAKEDGIDLVEEEANFKRWCKKQDLRYLDLDDTIEAKLKDKIEEEKVKDIKKAEIKKSPDKK